MVAVVDTDTGDLVFLSAEKRQRRVEYPEYRWFQEGKLLVEDEALALRVATIGFDLPDHCFGSTQEC